MCVYVSRGVSEETGMGQNLVKLAGGTKEGVPSLIALDALD